jgi:hypothetical protein
MLSPACTGRSSLMAGRKQQALNLRRVRAFPQLLRHRTCTGMVQHPQHRSRRSAALVCVCCAVLSAVAPAAATAPQLGSTAQLWPHLSAERSGCSDGGTAQSGSDPADKLHWPTEAERRATAADVLAVLSGEHLHDVKWVSLVDCAAAACLFEQPCAPGRIAQKPRDIEWLTACYLPSGCSPLPFSTAHKLCLAQQQTEAVTAAKCMHTGGPAAAVDGAAAPAAAPPCSVACAVQGGGRRPCLGPEARAGVAAAPGPRC